MEIVVYPDPILKKISRPITDEELASGFADGISLNKLVDDMNLIMLESRGAGISAIQVGVPLRFFLVALQNASPLVFVNPVLSNPGKPIEFPEGCLSFPGVNMRIRRPATIHVSARNLQGTPFEMDADSLRARVIQHEYDHLDGRGLVTRGNVTLNRRNIRALERLEKDYAIWQERMALRAKKAAAAAPPPPAGGVTIPVQPKQVYGEGKEQP